MAFTDFCKNVVNLFEPAGELEKGGNVDLTDDGWYTSGGEKISKDKALKYSAVFRAVKLISTSVGKLPLFVYDRLEQGKQKAPSSPAYNILRYKPNDEMTAKIFKQTITAHALLQGSGYAYIFRDNAGRPIELIPLVPDVTYPIRRNGQLYYITSVNGDMMKLLPENVLHVRGLGYNGITSYSLLEYANISFSMGLNGQNYSNKFFENSARPSVILEHPQTFSDEKAITRLRDQWSKLYSGVSNAHKTAILEQGMKAHVLTLSARDSQLIETMKFSIIDVANWFSLPPHKLGDSSRTAYNSLEQENQSFLDEALDDWLVTWEEECRDKLLTEKEKNDDSRLVEFARQALVRADLKGRAEYYAKATAGAPWMTVNEVRNLENANDAGEEYDEIILPANVFGSTEEEEETNSTTTEPENNSDTKPKGTEGAIAAARGALEHVFQKMLTRIRKDFDNYSKRNEVHLFTENFDSKHSEVIKREVEPVAKVVEMLTGETELINKTIKKLMREVQG
jgi:HK97 family phage portal protein